MAARQVQPHYQPQRPQEWTFLKILILGDSGVGKTSLTNQLGAELFNHPGCEPNDFYRFVTKQTRIDDKPVGLHIWEWFGQAPLSIEKELYFDHVDCCIHVFDVTSTSSLMSLDSWKAGFLEQIRFRGPECFSFLVVGNKCDLVAERRITGEMINNYYETNACDMLYYETSAATDRYLYPNMQYYAEAAFEKIAREALSQNAPDLTNCLPHNDFSQGEASEEGGQATETSDS